ncbi:MAG: hypothetical protein WAT09_02600, partial [Paracoccaceae bacterium]
LDGLTRAADAAEAVIQAELEDPLNGVFNAPSNDITRPHHRSKIDADPESQAFIRPHVMTQTFAQAPTAVAANFRPDRRATAAGGTAKARNPQPANRLESRLPTYTRLKLAVVDPFERYPPNLLNTLRGTAHLRAGRQRVQPASGGKPRFLRPHPGIADHLPQGRMLRLPAQFFNRAL